jgi:SAM-dependent methyltransferase
MDSTAEAQAYDAMDHAAVNGQFVDDLIAAWGGEGHRIVYDLAGGEVPPINVIDLGTGTAQIPILLCQRLHDARVLAIDGAPAMLDVAMQNIDIAGLRGRIELRCVEASSPPRLGRFDIVMSNSLVHHLHRPAPLFENIRSLTSQDGLIFVRDLARPHSESTLEDLVERYAGSESAEAREMFRASLYAALTVDEVRKLVAAADFDPGRVAMTSDRHWTWSCDIN